MRAFRVSLAVAALMAGVHFSPPAQAGEGLVTTASQISESARAALAKDIEAYRAKHPEAFEAVRNVRGHKPEVYKEARNPIPLVGRELRRLGPSALLPMLHALAFEAPPRGNLTDAEWNALQVGMLEAVGVLRDARSAPVLLAAFEAPAAPVVLRAAAEALGRLGGDAELSVLTKHASAAGERRAPALAGLGQCRRLESASFLASALTGAADEATAALVAEAMGDVGSSWAWAAKGPSAAAAGLAVRDVAAKALVASYARRAGASRAAVESALRMLEHPRLAELVHAERVSAAPEARVALDGLLQRVAPRR